MSTIGIIGAGEVGSHIAAAAIRCGHEVVLANSRGPETLSDLIGQFGASARAVTAREAALAGDVVVIAVPLKLENNMPAAELAGKVVIDTNNYMAWRDGHFPVVDSYEKTEHELRQEQLPHSKVVKAFTHIQAPRILTWGKPTGAPDRLALAAASDFPEAIEVVRTLYDQFGFDTVAITPMAESWRITPGQPAWKQERHSIAELRANLAKARPVVRP
ncbi:NADP oxidoreductase [Rhizobium sp. Root274]|uniref:NADPH-dependent F420 reductase n=1 Tax=unclassified Rhizobium TaxID=2613769 RepID=UPI0007155305|nr:MULTISPECIES: NAD(P)-binding domain-containing protein [unclassified Rhizobium]KQW26422.1 NADP oxidoreductase [Rhizobium sp. Root1240]KRD26393.1 NADP oxidoreductase [Rhizobium sp. Root274]